MSYINPVWMENEYIERVMAKDNFDITDYQARCDNEIELVCLMQNIGVSDIPVDDITGCTTSPILIKYGIDYLTFLIADSKAQAGVENSQNDVYDGVAKKHLQYSKETADKMTKNIILNITKEELPAGEISFIDSFPIY